MTNENISKKRKPHTKSKAAQIRKLFEQGKLTPKQIGEKTNAPMPYVYVVRSKMRADARGLPAVAENKKPVFGGIQGVPQQDVQAAPTPTTPAAPTYVYVPPVYIPPRAPTYYTTLEKPPLMERIKERVRAWFA
jgi:hypothetical protein